MQYVLVGPAGKTIYGVGPSYLYQYYYYRIYDENATNLHADKGYGIVILARQSSCCDVSRELCLETEEQRCRDAFDIRSVVEKTFLEDESHPLYDPNTKKQQRKVRYIYSALPHQYKGASSSLGDSPIICRDKRNHRGEGGE